MKLCKSNVYTTKIFVPDPDRELKLFSYDADRYIPRILVSKHPVVTTQSFGDHCYVEPISFKSEKEFNLLAIAALLRACNVQGNIVGTVFEAAEHFLRKNTPFGWILVSKDFEFTESIYSDLYSMDMQGRFIRVDGLKDTEMLFVPAADYLGVIAMAGDDLDKYGIAVVNSSGPVLVELP